MKGITLAIFITVVLFNTGCEKADIFLQLTENKIEGTWKYDEVKYQKFLSLSTKDKTGDYRDLEITFKDHGVAVLDNVSTGEWYNGSWDLRRAYRGGNDDDGDGQLLLEIDVKDLDGNRFTQQLHLGSVTKKKIRGRENADNGIFYFNLKKK